MTTPGFIAMSSAVARTKDQIYRTHCAATGGVPAAPVRTSMRCVRCKGVFNYTVSAIDGRTTGRCSSAGCLQWPLSA